MRRIALTLATAGLLAAGTAMPALASPSPSPATVQVVPLFSCVSGAFYWASNNGSGGVGDLESSRWRMESDWTDLCGNSKTASNVEFNILGTNNCLTYAGSKSGGGYIDAITCALKASQKWNWYDSSQLITNDYLGGSYCAQANANNTNITIPRCNGGDAQQWALQGI